MRKKLYKSRSDRMISGVCGGIAEFFEIDSSIVRIIAVILTIMSGFWPFVVVYVILSVIMPYAPRDYKRDESYNNIQKDDNRNDGAPRDTKKDDTFEDIRKNADNVDDFKQ